MTRVIAFACALVALAGCSKRSDKPASTLTEHQRDSVLATEPLPGADVVGRALQASVRADRRAEKLDSLAN